MKKKPSKTLVIPKIPGVARATGLESEEGAGAHDAHTPPPTPHRTTSQHHGVIHRKQHSTVTTRVLILIYIIIENIILYVTYYTR